MISKENFCKMISILQGIDERSDELNRLKIDLVEYSDDYHKVICMLQDHLFSEAQLDWYNWWMYERTPLTGGKNLEAYDENGNEINFETPELLYDFLMTI